MFKKNPKLKAIKVHLVIGVDRANGCQDGPIRNDQTLGPYTCRSDLENKFFLVFFSNTTFSKVSLKKNIIAKQKYFFSFCISWVLL